MDRRLMRLPIICWLFRVEIQGDFFVTICHYDSKQKEVYFKIINQFYFNLVFFTKKNMIFDSFFPVHLSEQVTKYFPKPFRTDGMYISYTKKQCRKSQKDSFKVIEVIIVNYDETIYFIPFLSTTPTYRSLEKMFVSMKKYCKEAIHSGSYEKYPLQYLSTSERRANFYRNYQPLLLVETLPNKLNLHVHIFQEDFLELNKFYFFPCKRILT